MNHSLEAVRITDKVWWVGAIDWGLSEFHGYTTRRGSTYNAYLVMADKPTLIDTVKAPFMDQMYARISSVLPLSDIRLIVSNHSEMDHSGGLPRAIADIAPEKVFASPNGVKALDAHFGIGGRLTAVGTGDTADLGGMSLAFIETRMLHWPDSMFSWLPEQRVLFSQDAFGMHLATDRIFADQNDPGVLDEELKQYFANILLPYAPRVLKQLEDLGNAKLSVEIIAPDHGPIWRQDLGRVLGNYTTWSLQKPEAKAVIVYSTMWHSTATMAASIADGVREAGASARVLPLDVRPRSDVATEVLCAGALLVGSPTINNNMFPTTADVLCYLAGLRPKNLVGAAFGSYGWSGEAVGLVSKALGSMGVDLVSDGIKVKYVPTGDDLENCFDLGLRVGESLKARIAAAG